MIKIPFPPAPTFTPEEKAKLKLLATMVEYSMLEENVTAKIFRYKATQVDDFLEIESLVDDFFHNAIMEMIISKHQRFLITQYSFYAPPEITVEYDLHEPEYFYLWYDEDHCTISL